MSRRGRSSVYLFYVDESGDSGLRSGPRPSPTKAFVLAALIVEERAWLSVLDELVNFRRWVSKNFRIRMRDEIKAGHLIHGTGPAAHLSPGARMRLYRQALRLLPKIGNITVWAIVVDKEKMAQEHRTDDPRRAAW